MKNEIGRTYGRLIVLSENGRDKHRNVLWNCKCSCGNETTVTGNRLRVGMTKSCGCLTAERISNEGRKKSIDETGNRYGRLVVISLDESGPFDELGWICVCDCGNQLTVRGSSLRDGDTKSCGCWKRDVNKLPKGEAMFRQVYLGYKNGAETRKLSWNLSREYTKEIMAQNCFYCGEPPSMSRNRDGANGDFTHNGIDRWDNSLGYSTENCVPCCQNCNHAKTNMRAEEFIAWVLRTSEHLRENIHA